MQGKTLQYKARNCNVRQGKAQKAITQQNKICYIDNDILMLSIIKGYIIKFIE